MSPTDPPSRYVAAVSRFAETLYPAEHKDQPWQWSAATTTVNPYPAPRPRVGAHPDTDTDGAADRPVQALDGRDGEQPRPDAGAVVDPAGPWPRPRTDNDLVPLLTAADRAQVLFPGPVGELIHREIHAHLEVGHRFGGDTLISRLAEQLLAPPHWRSDVAGERDSREVGRGSSASPGPPAGDHPNAVAYRHAAAAFRSGDLAAIETLVDPDVVWHVPGTHRLAGDHHGRPAVLEFIHQLPELGFWLREHDVFGNDQHVCALSEMGASRPGVQVHTRVVSIFHFRDHRQVERWLYPEDLPAWNTIFAEQSLPPDQLKQ